MVISGGIVVTSAVAGRLTSRVPTRLLVGPGLIVVGIGLLLMRGLDAGSAWTHLIPKMIVGGVGVGVVNPPLASTAVGVVPPHRVGMASGINSTFRQVGIATGIALLGTLLSNNVKDEVLARVAAVPGLSRSGPQIATAVQSGEIRNVIARLPEHARSAVGMITRAAFTTGLNRILLVAAVIALVSGVVSRSRKQPETANIITQADRCSAVPGITAAPGACPGVIGHDDERCPDCSCPSVRPQMAFTGKWIYRRKWISRPIHRRCWHSRDCGRPRCSHRATPANMPSAAVTRTGSVLLLICLVIGAIAGGQRPLLQRF